MERKGRKNALEILYNPKVHFTSSQIDRIIKLFSQGVIDGKNSGFGFKADARAKTIRCIVTVSRKRNTFILIISSFSKKEEIRIFLEQEPVFKSENRISRSRNRFFVKTAQCF